MSTNLLREFVNAFKTVDELNGFLLDVTNAVQNRIEVIEDIEQENILCKFAEAFEYMAQKGYYFVSDEGMGDFDDIDIFLDVYHLRKKND